MRMFLCAAAGASPGAGSTLFPESPSMLGRPTGANGRPGLIYLTVCPAQVDPHQRRNGSILIVQQFNRRVPPCMESMPRRGRPSAADVKSGDFGRTKPTSATCSSISPAAASMRVGYSTTIEVGTMTKKGLLLRRPSLSTGRVSHPARSKQRPYFHNHLGRECA